jgi:hypothetical protein
MERVTMVITYKQAREDHEYLWGAYGPAYDMTGAYVDQEDLALLLRKPSKITARDCYCRQIDYWFRVGPDNGSLFAWGSGGLDANTLIESDPKLKEIAVRHGLIDECN